MPINLAAALTWRNASDDEQRMLQSLQGNILKGHGRKFTANIFFRFDPARQPAARRLLRELANYHLTSAHRQLLDSDRFKEEQVSGSPFVHLALSAKGYGALGLAASAPADADFQGGMKAAASVAALSDPAVATWEAPFQQDPHALLLAADETDALSGALEALIAAAGGTVVYVQRGRALINAAADGIENFGYVDGRSQPLLLQEDIDAESKGAGRARWDPGFTLAAALVKDPGTADPNAFGSFFVFRKLEQDVRGFKRREQEIADVLGLAGEERELAGAMIVGRFEDGTPVTLSDEARGLRPPNDFDYGGDAGRRCPFHAHIRKSNPRGSGGAELEPIERGHLMPRRGIPYEDVKRAVHPNDVPGASTLAEFNAKVAPLLPTGGVGLLFMAYNGRIAQQFKFTQQTWVNSSGFPTNPAGPHGIDPVIGQNPVVVPTDQKLPKEWDNPAAGTANNVSFSGFVKMRGGEYFFSPSLGFLRDL
jgi:Dyp-type peroxidase family